MRNISDKERDKLSAEIAGLESSGNLTQRAVRIRLRHPAKQSPFAPRGVTDVKVLDGLNQSPRLSGKDRRNPSSK